MINKNEQIKSKLSNDEDVKKSIDLNSNNYNFIWGKKLFYLFSKFYKVKLNYWKCKKEKIY